MENVIYGLIDPNTNMLKYIGYSCNLPKRIIAHCNPCNLQKMTHKNNWLKQLIAGGQKPIVIILERYDSPNELPEAEKEVIAYYRFLGCKLLNGTDGGDGCLGRILSEETKRKIATSNTGKKQSLETRAKWRAANKGKPSPNKGKKASPELRKKLSEAHMGKQGKKRIFTLEQEMQILADFVSEPMTKIELAQKYGVSRDTIFRIFRRHSGKK